MVDDAEGRGRRQSEPPPFDSLAGLRALGDVQRRGLEAANLVVSRLITQLERGGPLFGAEPPSPTEPDASRAVTNGTSDLFTQWAQLTWSFFNGLLSQNGAASPSGVAPATVSADAVSLTGTHPGGRAEGELWLHNRSGAAVANVHVHCGDLRRHGGEAVAAACVRFDPACLEELPDLSSRGIRVTVEVPADAAPGVYRGTVLAANLPHVWLPIELDVVEVS